jgi:hypothetical protein
MLLLLDVVDEVLPERRLRPGEEPGPAGVPPGEADAALAEQRDFAGVVHVLERVADTGLEGSGRGVMHNGLAALARLIPEMLDPVSGGGRLRVGGEVVVDSTFTADLGDGVEPDLEGLEQL